MFCKNCGCQMNPGYNNCPNCGAPVAFNGNNMNNMNNNQYQQPQQMYYNGQMQQPPKQKSSFLKKLLTGFLILILIGGGILLFVFLTSKKLVCTSSEGSITLMYNGSKITGYKTKNATYDLDKGNELVEQIGIDEYLKEFENWFKSNTSDGTCEYK